MSFEHVRTEAAARDLARVLSDAERVALDCEAAGFHRYSDRLCLVQLTAADTTWIIDPFEVDGGALLQRVVEDPEVEVLMHGADFDLRLLRRDLGLGLRGLFDTQIAASLLGERALGLAALLESRLGVRLSKKHQRADWARRPLPDEMLEYAADDTRHLPELAARLRNELEAAGRTAWAEEEMRHLEESAGAEPDEDEAAPDPVTRVKGARDLPPRTLALLREALSWRDDVARQRDRAPFRVVGDAPLIQVALTPPARPEDLAGIKGFPSALARERGGELLARLQEVAGRPPQEWAPYPRNHRRGRGYGRPTPEVEALADELKAVRNRRADELGLDRGTLLPNAVVLNVAWEEPGDLAALRRVKGMRRWQADVVGHDLLEVILRHG